MNLTELLKDQIYFKILKFFSENPNSIDTPKGIATWTGQDREIVKSALDKLVKIGILTAHKVSSTTGYSYTDDPQLKKKIDVIIKKQSK